MLKAEVTKDPGRGRDGKVSVKGRGRLGMECRWAVGRQAALLSQAQTRADGMSGAWQGAGVGAWAALVRLGVKQLQNQRAGLRWRRWPESPSMGRSYESRTGTEEGGGMPPTPPWDSAGSQRAPGLHGKLGGTAPSHGAPLPSRRVPDNCFISELEEGQALPITPHSPNSAPRGGEENERRQEEGVAGSTGSSYLRGGSREVVEAGSEEERKDHVRTVRTRGGLSRL